MKPSGQKTFLKFVSFTGWPSTFRTHHPGREEPQVFVSKWSCSLMFFQSLVDTLEIHYEPLCLAPARLVVGCAKQR